MAITKYCSVNFSRNIFNHFSTIFSIDSRPLSTTTQWQACSRTIYRYSKTGTRRCTNRHKPTSTQFCFTREQSLTKESWHKKEQMQQLSTIVHRMQWSLGNRTTNNSYNTVQTNRVTSRMREMMKIQYLRVTVIQRTVTSPTNTLGGLHTVWKWIAIATNNEFVDGN